MIKELFDLSAVKFKKATVDIDDWDYCAINVYRANPTKAFQTMKIMRYVNNGMTVTLAARKCKTTAKKAVVMIRRGIRTMNKRIYELPEHKLVRLLKGD